VAAITKVLHRFFMMAIFVNNEHGISGLGVEIWRGSWGWGVHIVSGTVQVLDHARDPFPDEFTVVI
jgi:hypothetical protein